MLNWHFHVNCWADLPVLWVLVQNLGQWKPGNRQDSAGINCQFNRDYQIPCSVLLSRHKTMNRVYCCIKGYIGIWLRACFFVVLLLFCCCCCCSWCSICWVQSSARCNERGKAKETQRSERGSLWPGKLPWSSMFLDSVLWEQHGTIGLPFVCAGTQPAPWQHPSASSMHGSCRLNWVDSVEIQGLTYNSSNQDVQMIMVSKAIPIGNLWDSVFCRNLLSSTHSL